MNSRLDKNKEIVEEIEQDKIKARNKKIVKILLWIFIPLIAFIILIFILVRYIGNIGIVVREYPVYNEKITKDLNGLKVVHFTCLHYNKYTSNKKITKLVNMINNIKPDIVIFTGDLIDKNYILANSEREFLIKELNRIEATVGKYAIKGEDSDKINEIYASSNFLLMNNSVEDIYINKSIINLVALEDKYNKDKILINEKANYVIFLTHKPDNVEKLLEQFDIDLVLAGHSHNGQISIPFIGRLIKKEGSINYYKDYYNIANTPFYISGGLGNNGRPLRLFNHPNINFYRLRTK